MKSEEWLKKAEEIMDNSTCWESVEDEVLKLYCLFSRCMSKKLEDGCEVLARSYVVEKVMRILSKTPIILDGDTKRLYASLKMQALEEVKNETES